MLWTAEQLIKWNDAVRSAGPHPQPSLSKRKEQYQHTLMSWLSSIAMSSTKYLSHQTRADYTKIHRSSNIQIIKASFEVIRAICFMDAHQDETWRILKGLIKSLAAFPLIFMTGQFRDTKCMYFCFSYEKSTMTSYCKTITFRIYRLKMQI